MSRLRYLTAGESHGPGLTAVLDGVPAGLRVDVAAVDAELGRRQRGHGRGARQSIEQDRVRVLGGVRHGRTTGAPLALFVANRDAANWGDVLAVEPPEEGGSAVEPVRVPRPGHADLGGALLYDLDDIRDVIERASARETAARVALGKALHVAARGVEGVGPGPIVERLRGQLGQRAGDVELVAEYLHDHDIACALAHPFFAVAAPLEPRHRRHLARLFPVWETRNGSRAAELNAPAAVYIDTHGGTGVAGSDDHAGVDIGRTWTQTPRAGDVREFLTHLREGRASAHGEQGSAAKWTHAALGLATGLWKTEGKTPAATLASAVLREMKTKGDQARFRKVGPGKFVAAK